MSALTRQDEFPHTMLLIRPSFSYCVTSSEQRVRNLMISFGLCAQAGLGVLNCPKDQILRRSLFLWFFPFAGNLIGQSNQDLSLNFSRSTLVFFALSF
jgi:hypothetical protein